jgi:hypothetical protein
VRGGGLTPGISVHFGHCCSPVPGDRIVGILEPEAGLTVHTIDCQQLAEFADDDSVWQDLQWTPQAEQGAVAAARVRATIKNAPGVLGQVATIIGEAGGNILNLVMTHRQQDFFDVDIDVEVEDAKHATAIMAALRDQSVRRYGRAGAGVSDPETARLNAAQMASPSYRLAAIDQDFLLSDSMRGVRFMMEYAKAERRTARLGRSLHHRGVRQRPDRRGRRRAAQPLVRRGATFGRLASERGGAMHGR